MYGKIFASLFTGSMRGKPDLQHVFVYMIANCDEEGVIDEVPDVIAGATGLPLERVQKAILALESPDPLSRTKEHEGRRIERIDEERPWGWRVINYNAYRGIQTKRQRKLYQREYQRDYKVAERTKKKDQVTWLTPFAELWKTYCGGNIAFGVAAKNLRPLVELHGTQAVEAAFEVYLKKTETVFTSVPSFCQRYGYWAKNGSGHKPSTAEKYFDPSAPITE